MAVDISDLPAPPKGVDISDLPPPPKEPSFGQKAMEFVEPTVEALGTAGGAVLGSALGPAGTVGGAGLGYGMSKEAMKIAREQLGYQKPRTGIQQVTEPVKEVLTGATYEAGGQALPSILGGIGKVGTSIGDLIKPGPSRAAKIAGEALGPNLQEARQVLKQAGDDLTASQALSVIDPKTGQAALTVPVAQALLKRAESRDANFFVKLFGEQEAKRYKTLENLAKGADATTARQAQGELKKQLNERLIPTLKTELEAANIAGKKLPKLRAEEARMGGAAKQKVEDVRRFQAAKGRAEGRQPLYAPSYMGGTRQPMQAPYRELPTQFQAYTYPAELAKRAEDVINQSADASLRFGEARNFAKAAADSLAAYNLKPLTASSVVNSIRGKLSDPSIAGNADLEKGLTRIAKDIKKWTDSNGVIDAFALDAIRKNSINSVARELFKDDVRAQKQFAGQVLESVKPVLIDAIEGAGGTGYRQYLEDYARGMQALNQTKLTARAQELYKQSPQQFVSLVEGNSPDEVEKIFGPGNYNIAKELSANIQKQLGDIAGQVKSADIAKQQAAAGTSTLADILKTNLGFQLPGFVSPKTAMVKKISDDVLDRLENYTSKETMRKLTEAARSGKSLDKLLSELPESEQQQILRVLTPSATAGGVIAGTQANTGGK